MGGGSIANQYANDLALTQYGKLAAVGSRSKAKAQTFAAQHGGVRAYGSYEEVVADPDVDIVYVATPHPFHMENTLLAIAHGKHVLCEKPIALNAKQTRVMIAAAQKKGVFLMEGMWTRFFPAMVQLRKRLAAGRIDKVIAVEADFGIHFKAGPEHRIFNPHLGGGASMILGAQPKKIVSVVHKHTTGVDDHAVIAFEYADGATASIGISSRVRMKNEVRIFGTKGMITVHEMFLHPNKLTLEADGKKPQTFDLPFAGQGMQFEADHVHQCLRKGQTESDIMPLNETLAIMQTMDKIRKQWKLRYPNE
jgi:predicted dehydrogenase